MEPCPRQVQKRTLREPKAMSILTESGSHPPTTSRTVVDSSLPGRGDDILSLCLLSRVAWHGFLFCPSTGLSSVPETCCSMSKQSIEAKSASEDVWMAEARMHSFWGPQIAWPCSSSQTACAAANAQISPGRWQPIRALMDRQLHQVPRVPPGRPPFLCGMHREIAAELQQHRGLHSTFSNSTPGSACVKCHSDTMGKLRTVHWEPTSKAF